MSKCENLTKVKIKTSQEKFLKFAKSSIQKIFDDIVTDMNNVNTMYVCRKSVESKLGVKSKKTRKEKITKIRNQNEKVILKRKLKR